MAFTYEALPPGQFIRILHVRVPLLRLKPTYQFEVVHVGDSATPLPRYEAVSYTWSKPGAPTSSINLTDGQSVSLGQTLTDLLAVLLKRQREFRIWIDAICINQSDPVEKAFQVAMMDRIYSRAWRVTVWLGLSTPLSQAVFAFTKSKRGMDSDMWKAWTTPTEEEHQGLTSLLEMLAHPWFRRVWIIQEVTLSNNVWMFCGDDFEGFGHFSDMVHVLWRLFRDWDDYDDQNEAYLGLWSVTRLISLRDEFLSKRQGLRWETLLQTAFGCKKTDQRDAVFAFRGIGHTTLPVPAPNYAVQLDHEPEYSLAVEKVYMDTATALLCHGTSLDLLALGGIERTRSPSLPTWVPDLRHFSFTEPFVVCDAAGWDTGGPLAGTPTVMDSKRLVIQAETLDCVDVLCREFDMYSVGEQQELVKEILALRTRQLKDVPEEVFLKDLAMDLIFGLNIDDHPAGPEYIHFFKEWLLWLRAADPDTADISEISYNAFYRTLNMRVGGWRPFGTQQGFFGIGPAEVEVGDVLCKVPGCRLPILLRRREPDESGAESGYDEYILVSWCYVSGIVFRGDSDEPGNMTKVAII